MERAAWLKRMRDHTEALYDHMAPAYWVTFGLYPNAAHRQYIEKFLRRLGPRSDVLDAGCGAGRYDGFLLEAGHRVLGIDQSGRMLARAREVFPQERYPALRYRQMGLQEMDFQAAFDGAVCMDALEHVPPEDWPGILAGFQKALRPGGVLYVTVDRPDWDEVRASYDRARALGLPVVFGEVVDEVDATSEKAFSSDWQAVSGAWADRAVYHYHPTLAQVRAWFDQAGLGIEETGTGNGYAHFLARGTH